MVAEIVKDAGMPGGDDDVSIYIMMAMIDGDGEAIMMIIMISTDAGGTVMMVMIGIIDENI